MLDEYTRQCVTIRVERQIRSEEVLATLWQAMATYGIPVHIRSDNSSEFIAKKIQQGLAKMRSRRCISIQVARGKTATSKAFTAVSATNV